MKRIKILLPSEHKSVRPPKPECPSKQYSRSPTLSSWELHQAVDELNGAPTVPRTKVTLAVSLCVH